MSAPVDSMLDRLPGCGHEIDSYTFNYETSHTEITLRLSCGAVVTWRNARESGDCVPGMWDDWNTVWINGTNTYHFHQPESPRRRVRRTCGLAG